ncbi:Putative transcriptional regulator, GerE domain protein [Candidatus Hamiltonella defensa (Bemisia tabaci)]|nr:Putative transcriptional regulator, GerE domain protein [Candidatus Hamiltonella defensa (Bemisia tabaci)]
MYLSHRTIENRLQKVYEKTGITSLSGLIEYCHTNGLNHYVPKNLLRQGRQFFGNAEGFSVDVHKISRVNHILIKTSLKIKMELGRSVNPIFLST